MRKTIIFLCIVFFALSSFSLVEEPNKITLSGVFNGENLIVENPFAHDGVGFCSDSVKVNGKLIKGITFSTTFEIPLNNLGLLKGDFIEIEIFHKNLCEPKIYNNEVVSIDSSSSLQRIEQCIITGHIYNGRKKEQNDKVNTSAVMMLGSNNEMIGFAPINNEDGSFTLTLDFDEVHQVFFEADGYQSKRIIIDLRNIPQEYQSKWKLETNIWLDTLSDIFNDSLLYSFSVDKMSYNPTSKKMEWDIDYRNAMERAFTYIRESSIKSDQLFQLEVEKQIEINRTKSQQLIIYCTIAIILFIALFLIWVIRISKQRKKDNTIITNQKQEIEKQMSVVEEAHKEIKDSIAYAKRIQNAILPPAKLVKEYLDNSFILYKPKDVVAGDFYWMEPKGDTVFFAAADCTGHGVPGAMVSVVCVNGLNRSVREFGLTEPGKILDNTRQLVIKEFEKSEEDVQDGMDIALCSLGPAVSSSNSPNGEFYRELKYAGANNPLWIVRNGEIMETKGDKQPIGKYALEKPFNTHTIHLQPGDTFYLFSDGYVDQFGGERNKKFKAKPLRELLLSVQDKPMAEQRTIIDRTFEDWRGDNEQIDDVCFIGVRI